MIDLSDFVNLNRCGSIDQTTGNCKSCPSKCCWNLHKNVPYICIVVSEEVIKTDEDLRQKYLKATDEKRTKESMITNLGQMYGKQQIEIQKTLTSVRQIIQELQVYYLDNSSIHMLLLLAK